MATFRLFDDMINEYLTNDLMYNSFKERTWIANNMEIDTGHPGGKVLVPFEGGHASSVKFGGLTAISDISSSEYVRGELAAIQELWGAMKFWHRDLELDSHGKAKEKSFLEILPKEVTKYAKYLKSVLSVHLLNGPVLANFTANGTAGGVIAVDDIAGFTLNQEIVVIDGNTSQATYFVIGKDINAKTITVSATFGGSAADVSAYTVAQSAKIYHPGVLVAGTVTNKFENLTDILLSAANGGSSSVHGVTKATYEFLQAYNHDGSTYTAASVLDAVFDAHTEFCSRGRDGQVSKVLMSLPKYADAVKALQTEKGPFKVVPKDGATKSTVQFGFQEINVMGVDGQMLTLVGLQEKKDSSIIGLDPSTHKMICKGDLINTRAAPDGRKWYEDRSATNGYSYVLDHVVYGQYQVHAPGKNWIIHSLY